jgi:uncharacterized membrane protein
MILWIAIAAAAQVINAIIVLVDKYVLVSHEPLGKPVVYAFYVSMLSGVVVVLLPFGVISVPTIEILVFSLLASIAFILSILSLYSALKKGHASDAVPIVGGVSAVTAVCLSTLFLAQDLPHAFIPAFLLLVVGTLLISRFRLPPHALRSVVFSGVCFGAAAVFLKLVFLETNFLDGFFWSRLTNVACAVALLAVPANRKAIFHGYRGTPQRVKWLVVSNKALSGVASVLTLFAISLGSVSVVNALAGLQFVFVFLFAWLGSRWLPNAFRGEVYRHTFTQQMCGVLAIVAGFLALFLV